MAKVIPLEKLPVLENTVKEYPGKEVFEGGAVIPVYKPENWTSFDVVKYIRNRIPVRKIGHAGTLDPLATGLLILCCGKATKSISQIQELSKTYIAEISFGASTPSFDAGTEFNKKADWKHIQKERLMKLLETDFIGKIEQIPPAYSALWKDGIRMYKLVRKGVSVNPEPRMVEVYSIELLDYSLPVITLKIHCGKGFYVRSLANDIGIKLGSLAYLSALERTKIGQFTVEQAWSIGDFNAWSRYE
jgi:tRNA pseudouridine55 synthase